MNQTLEGTTINIRPKGKNN
jgi:hypothetical protein